MKELRLQRSHQELIYKQKSWKEWLKEGDRNTKFFRTSVMIKRQWNKINFVQQGFTLLTTQKEISSYFIESFKELFASKSMD